MLILLIFLLILTSEVFSDTLSSPDVLKSPLYPCSSCHGEIKTDPTKRRLTFHDDIVLDHDNLWCLDCHSDSDRNKLKLTGGKSVSFGELQQLCGICHGIIFNQWSNGIHGKRTGQWNDSKHYLLCTSCHNPHSPKFRPLKPEKAPLRPEMTLRRR